MAKVVFDMSMSLDGFVTGANARPPETGLGEGGEQLHEWFFNSADPRNHKIVESMKDTGVVIVGRTTYNHSIFYWGADGPSGARRLPTIIVSHHVPNDVPENGVYTFVNNVEDAVVLAKKLAGDKVVGMMGGNIAQQAIMLGLLDEIQVHIIPTLFGTGTRLIDDLLGKHAQLELLETIETKEAVHLRYRVVK